MPADHLVAHRLIGAALTREHGVQRFDRLVGAGQTRGAQQLREDLTPENTVVLELLVGALVVQGTGDSGRGRVVIDGDFLQIQAREKVAPHIGHANSVSDTLSD